MSYFHELFTLYGVLSFPAIDCSLVLSAQGGVGRCVADLLQSRRFDLRSVLRNNVAVVGTSLAVVALVQQL